MDINILDDLNCMKYCLILIFYYKSYKVAQKGLHEIN